MPRTTSGRIAGGLRPARGLDRRQGRATRPSGRRAPSGARSRHPCGGLGPARRQPRGGRSTSSPPHRFSPGPAVASTIEDPSPFECCGGRHCRHLYRRDGRAVPRSWWILGTRPTALSARKPLAPDGRDGKGWGRADRSRDRTVCRRRLRGDTRSGTRACLRRVRRRRLGRAGRARGGACGPSDLDEAFRDPPLARMRASVFPHFFAQPVVSPRFPPRNRTLRDTSGPIERRMARRECPGHTGFRAETAGQGT